MRYVIESGHKMKNKKTGRMKIYWAYFESVLLAGLAKSMTYNKGLAKKYDTESLAKADVKNYFSGSPFIKISKVK